MLVLSNLEPDARRNFERFPPKILKFEDRKQRLKAGNIFNRQDMQQNSQNKSQIRALFKSQRDQQNQSSQFKNSEQFCELFIQKFLQASLSHPALKNIQNIGVYLAQTGELNLSPLIKMLWALNKNLYVPIIQNQNPRPNSPNSKILKFGKYTEHTQCHPNAYFEKFGVQILEPIKPLSFIHPAELDLVLLPLLAFDFQGTRLGTGGGYYDATFNPIKNNKNNPSPQSKPYLLGCGFDCQKSEILIPKDPWDVKLDGALTSQEFCEF